MSKKYDLAVKVGEYQDSNGETKKRWKNVGAVVQGKDGFFILMDKTFNPAGLAEPDRESIMISMFEPRQNDQQGGNQGQQQGNNQQQGGYQQQNQGGFNPNANTNFDDDPVF
jgi:hypothetical protein